MLTQIGACRTNSWHNEQVMNIAIWTHYFAPEIGAPSARLSDLARLWAQQGHGVRVLTCFPNHPTGVVPSIYRGRLTQRETMSGFEVYRSWTYATPNRGTIRKTIGHLSYLISALLLSAPRVGQIDAAIGSSPTLFAALGACLFSMARRIPFVFEVRDLWPAIFVELGILKPGRLLSLLESLELWLYQHAARIVTVTESFRVAIIARGIDAAKIVTIPNGADTDFFTSGTPDPELRKQYAPSARFVALYIGAHGISHGLMALLDVAERLRERSDIAFLFVGEGAERDQLIAAAESRHLSNVRFLPGQPKAQMPELYRMADACFVPLRNIPLFKTFIPSKMFEIMACGRPIIGSVAGEARDLLAASGGALLCPPEDSAAIANAVLRLADDPTLRQQLGANGRAYVEHHYRRDDLAMRYLSLLTTLTGKP